MIPSLRPIVINGRFLSQKLSGVQRYAREITVALDRLITADPVGLGNRRWQLVMPPNAVADLPLTTIEPRVVGRLNGHLWEQIDLPRAARAARLINLCNAGPLLHRHSTVVIHDAAPFRTPDNFGVRYGGFHRVLGWILARTSLLGTVSQFSRSELADVLGVPEGEIFVAGNGCDHLLDRPRSPDILSRLDLRARRYFLFVGSPTPNKNLGLALDAFRRLKRDDVRFVVAGSINKAVYGDVSPTLIPGVIVASDLTDADIAGLYASATAHVFPTRYEGFGIPPLEAMACGCPVLASNIQVVREVCADAAVYFAPDDPAALSRLMAEELARSAPDPVRQAYAAARVAHFTWAAAARDLAAAITR